MKNFITKFLLFSLPLLALLSGVNYFGDAANLFNRDYEEEIADILSSGMNVTNISNYDERLLQEEIINDMKYIPDVAIIGSSRAMLISEDYFPGRKVMNNSVSGASLEDLIAIYQIYKENQKLPKKIILGIDPWTFQEDDNRSRWKSIGQYYYQFKNEDNNSRHFLWNQLLSFSYFQESFPHFVYNVIGNNSPQPTNQEFNTTITKLDDGSLVYGIKSRNVSVEQVDNSAKLWLANGMINRYKNFNSLQPKWAEFESLILDMTNNGAEVEIILTPFYPLVYKEMTIKFNIINQIENNLINKANKNQLKVHGSYNPIKMELNENMFYDETHPKEVVFKKIFEKTI